MSETRPVAYVDKRRSTALPNHTMAAFVVYSDGVEELWILTPEGDHVQGNGCACVTCAPHEQGGERDAVLNAALLRNGRTPTRTIGDIPLPPRGGAPAHESGGRP
jgi:hypothetical protein